MTKFHCLICKEIVAKYSLVSEDILKYVNERELEKWV